MQTEKVVLVSLVVLALVVVGYVLYSTSMQSPSSTPYTTMKQGSSVPPMKMGIEAFDTAAPADQDFRWRRQSARRGRQHRLSRRSREIPAQGRRQVRRSRQEPRQGRPHDGHPCRKGHAVRRLPLRPG